jgi:hypothetical protein
VPSSKNYVRDIAQEDKTAKERGEQGTGHDSKSAVRHRARRNALKLGMIKPGSKKDIDHKNPLAKGGSNDESNLRVRSEHANRSFPRTKDAGMK